VEEDFNDEDKELFEDVARLSIITVDRQDTSQDIIRTL